MVLTRPLLGKPVAPHLSRRAMPLPLDEPLLVVAREPLVQRVAQVFDGLDGAHPHELLLEATDKALDDPITFRGPHKGGAGLDAEKGELLLEDVAHILAAVIGPHRQSRGEARLESAEAAAYGLADRLQGCEVRADRRCRHPQLAGQHIQRFTAQQPQYRIRLLPNGEAASLRFRL
jgi:hypothetical protein